MVGWLAVSRAGHDKGTFYLIIKEDSTSVYLVDGVFKTCAAPKKKNKKHIQPIHRGVTVDELEQILRNPADADTAIKRCIKVNAKQNDKEIMYV